MKTTITKQELIEWLYTEDGSFATKNLWRRELIDRIKRLK